jgi:hypothetical protein
MSTLATSDLQQHQLNMEYFTEKSQGLMEQEDATRPPLPQPTYDPRALLNPTTAKRPASVAGSERGREDPHYAADAGQISLVERLHNVQERTASPSKRPKPDDPQKSRPLQLPGRGGFTLDMQNVPKTGLPSLPPPSASKATIDLTMSKYRRYALSPTYPYDPRVVAVTVGSHVIVTNAI